MGCVPFATAFMDKLLPCGTPRFRDTFINGTTLNTSNNFRFRAQSVCRKAIRRHSATVRNRFDVLGWVQGNFTRVFRTLADSNGLPAVNPHKVFSKDV